MTQTATDETLTESDPLWYKDAVIYELHVRAFADSNGDGIGDFAGLTSRLEYLQGLGVTALWLLPFYPSPLRDDGYDISDYMNINPAYGTLKDFKRFLKRAHELGMRVITELVINHTSAEHEWFQRARRSPPGSAARNLYVWSETPDRYQETRIIFKDFETSNWSWDPVAQAYYWHRFYSHQPDLNFDNPAVHKALIKVLDFWLGMGVDGMRLDAVPYLYERDGTNCENLPETHAYLKNLRAYIDKRYEGRMLLAEANQWPEDAAAYFGEGDECHMNFHFPLMPRMFMAVQLEDSFPILDILEQTPEIPETCQWATFLRNHDELTLEMVTDADRDYMYRMYASEPRARINLGIRRRLAPLSGLRQKTELLNTLLFSLPGTPVLYYGDEIGMGDNIYLGDRNGVRTPMQWSGDRNAGFSRANPQKLYFPVITDPEYHYEAVNVEAQENNPHSLLWWMKRLIDLRKQHPVLGRGKLRPLNTENSKVLAFLREGAGEVLLIVANLSRSAQFAELDLREYDGYRPVELFGRKDFPFVGRLPYLLTLSPYGFFWFALEAVEAEARSSWRPTQVIPLPGGVETLVESKAARKALLQVLPGYLAGRRWFRSKARVVKSVSITEYASLRKEEPHFLLCFCQVAFAEGQPETYFLPLSVADGDDARTIEQSSPHAVVAAVKRPNTDERAILYDGVYNPAFSRQLLELFHKRRRLTTREGSITSSSAKVLRDGAATAMEGTLLGVEQSNTSILYGTSYICKIFRRLDPGLNPDVEIGQFLSERSSFRHTPALLGALEYEGRGGASALAILQEYCPNQGDAWAMTNTSLELYFERCLTESIGEVKVEGSLLERARNPLPEQALELCGVYPDLARLLGTRTGEMHRALAESDTDAAFTPEPFNAMYQRSLYESTRTQLKRTVGLLTRERSKLAPFATELAEELLSRKKDLELLLKKILSRKILAQRIRIHGDYHLGQVLFTGKDFMIIDFEGEPGRSLSERRFKACPLRDVAGMIRSFHYASTVAARQALRASDMERVRTYGQAWYRWISAAFLGGYFEALKDTGILPAEDEPRGALLDFFLLDKCLYELDYELNNRPDWVTIPLVGLGSLIEGFEAGA